jgi:hypothetical protein
MKQRTAPIVQRPLNSQAAALEEAEHEIRQAVKEWYLKGERETALMRKGREIIARALKKISIPDLREVARVSLTAFLNRQRQTIASMGRGRLFLFLCMALLMNVGGDDSPSYIKRISKASAAQYVKRMVPSVSLTTPSKEHVNEYGTPLGMYMKDYMEKHVKPVFDRLIEQEPIDYSMPEYIKRRNTLRNRAEIEVRYQAHIDQLAEFRARGVKLVIVSAHADCSDRCRPWQGKVYSLDGTSGITEDGRTYQPIENATNILTKNGKWYNGLFGFNCRHRMVEYRPGLRWSIPPLDVERKEYALTVHQRALERRVREWRTKADMYRGVLPDAAARARSYAARATREYEAFCRANARAIERSRITV